MQSKDLSYLVKALQQQDDLLTCQECEDLLPDYLQAEMADTAHAVGWQAVARHLQGCPHCTNEYAILKEMLAIVYNDENRIQDRTAMVRSEPDLSFLPHSPAATAAEQPWWVDEIGRFLIALSEQLLQTWQPTAIGAAVGLKSAGKSPELLFAYVAIDRNTGRQITVQIEQIGKEAQQCIVAVTVQGIDPESLNLDGVAVTMRAGGQLIDTQWTDAFGVVLFEEVPIDLLPTLVLEVVPSP